MTKEIYEKLRHRLGQYFLGFPATDSGVELRVLKKLFSREDAEVFLASPLLPSMQPKEACLTMIRRITTALADLECLDSF